MESNHRLAQVLDIPLALWVGDDVILIDDLARVTVARGPRYSKKVFAHVEDHVVLAHEGTTEDQLVWSVKALHGHTVLIILVAEQVLARVPLKGLDSALGGRHIEAQYRIAHKVVLGTHREAFLVVIEADYIFVLLLVDPSSFAVTLEIEHTEPVKVVTYDLEKPTRHRGES